MMGEKRIECKHERISMITTTGKVFCFNEECKETFAQDDVIILLKTHVKRMQDVIEAGEKLSVFIDDNVMWGNDYAESDPTAEIEHSVELREKFTNHFNALSAYDKREA